MTLSRAKGMLEAFRAWINRSPKWLLTAAITVLSFIAGYQHNEIGHLRNAVEVLEEEKRKVHLRAINDDTRQDVSVLKKIAENHAKSIDSLTSGLDRYKDVVANNTAAVEGLARQVGRLAERIPAR